MVTVTLSFNMEETYIFHETQEGLLCGQHCLNNLLQQSIFTAIDLSDIAIQLDAKEREIYADRNDNISSTANRRSGK